MYIFFNVSMKKQPFLLKKLLIFFFSTAQCFFGENKKQNERWNKWICFVIDWPLELKILKLETSWLWNEKKNYLCTNDRNNDTCTVDTWVNLVVISFTNIFALNKFQFFPLTRNEILGWNTAVLFYWMNSWIEIRLEWKKNWKKNWFQFKNWFTHSYERDRFHFMDIH